MSESHRKESRAPAAEGPPQGSPPPGPPMPGRPAGFGHPGRGPVVKPKQFGATMRRLWSYFGKERAGLALIAVFVAVSAAIGVAGPYLIGVGIDAIAAGDLGLLPIVIVALVAAYAGEGGLSFLQGWMMAGLSQRVVAGLRASLFAKLQKLPLGFFDSRSHGEVMSRLTNDLDNVSTTISQSTVQLMSGALAIVGSLVMMLVLSPALTLAALVTVPLVYLLARTITKRTSVLFKDQQAHLGALNGHIEETITGQHIVKAFNHEEKSIEQFEAVNAKLYDAAVKAQVWSGFMMPLLSVINNIGFAAIALAGGLLAVQGSITVGVIASFVGYSRQFVRPLNELAQTYNVLQAGVAGAERAFEVLDEAEETPDAPGAVELIEPKGEVVFENVSFGYRPDVPILRNVSFPGEQNDNHNFLADESVIKMLCVVIRYLGTRTMLLRTHSNTLDFMKDVVVLLSNVAGSIEIPGREQALCLLQFLLSFAPTPGPTTTNKALHFPTYEPSLHSYAPHSVDALAKLLARDEPNRGYYKQLFSTDANNAGAYELLTRTFALAISPLPDKTKEQNRNPALPSLIETRKPFLMQGLLSAEILASLAPGPEAGVARSWLTSENQLAQNIYRLVQDLGMLYEKPPPPPPPAARGANRAPPPRKDPELVYIVVVAVALLRRLVEKARDPQNRSSSVPSDLLPQSQLLMNALTMQAPEWTKEGMLPQLTAIYNM